jgi:SAM-dependent methyltransferase
LSQNLNFDVVLSAVSQFMDPQLNNQVEYWNRVASSKTFTHPLDLTRFSRLVKKEDRILDFGCGYGRLCDELRRAGFQNVLGVDSSPQMIERAQGLFPDIAFQVVPSFSLPFPDHTFDAVTLFAVLTCVISNEAQEQLIRELSRVLRPGGILYVSDYPLQEDDRNTMRYERDRGRFGNYGAFETSDGAVVRHHAAQWIASLLDGFREHAFFYVDLMTMNGNEARGFQYLGEKI